MTDTTLTTTIESDQEEMTDEEWQALPTWKKVGAFVIGVPVALAPFAGEMIIDYVAFQGINLVIQEVTNMVQPDDRQAPTL